MQNDSTCEMDFFTNDIENRVWDPDHHVTQRWQDYEKYINKLSTLDQMIVYYYYHEYYSKTEIAEMLHWQFSKILFRLKKINTTLKLLMRPALTYAELEDTDLDLKDKTYLVMFDKCLGNTTEVGRRLNKNQSHVRYNINRIKKKLNGSHHEILEKVTYNHYPEFARGHGSQLFDPLVTR